MRTTLSRLLLTALTVAAFAGLTTSASAASWGNEHAKVRAYLGHIGITDHEGSGNHEYKQYKFDGRVFGKLSPTSLSFKASPAYCAGDEVRVHVVVTGQTWVNDRTMKVTAQLVMYEGASCNSDDLDGVSAPITFNMQPGDMATKYLHVDNTDEGGDWAGAWITFEALKGVGV
ncbi:hypothetical protein DVA67_021350 [Solirubrobacter sp. CPCC 204708]|uniref:Uncharacterized protein n=1 Tax=Solirubrobacter deserti TaxID=2282478 RepID=A0ABT4REM8_9ACTN|nr:hypothetical protein [Solirubrobacter deserti]MBE2318541.1 hypothetical protein [Solirubrobacter deserti]MDA0136999.1 hypothetical protein [Solirubrobacter deserti]